ncbi:16S rRNA (guanine(527)-N(7))-methyltransferase RsmG [Gammaproteobacteria bacterium]|nr:16S rRNA (guanine(527)-N(7))-methyltransferase RsmG [Gammaproteobacteria bacterium]
MNRLEYLSKGIEQQAQDVSQEQVAQLDNMLDILNSWNDRHNLTRIRDAKEQCVYLIFDALAALTYFSEARHVLDVGTGAGFPGIPLAICLPDVIFHLNDVNQKKMAYLKHLKSRLNLNNIVLHPHSVETVQVEYLDLITARAVAQPKQLHQMTKHLLHEDLKYILYVSEDTAAENQGEVIKMHVPDAIRSSYLLCQSNSDLQG